MIPLFGRLAGIRFRLLAFNVLLVFLPVAGVLFLDTYEQQLLDDQERSMVEQGRVLAATLAGRGALRADDVRHTLVQLRQRSEARLRVVDADGRVLADSSLLGPRAEPGDAARSNAAGPAEGWLYRLGALPFRLWRRTFAPPEPPHRSAEIYTGGGPLLGAEVRAALAGRYGAATRISSGGQRSVTLYSALPVRDGRRVVGAVLVSQSTYRILRHLYELRIDVLRIFLASLGAAVVLSLLVSRTIARPLARLRNQAEHVLDARGRLQGSFGPSRRHDEIGDLARSLERLRARLEAHVREVEAFASDVSHEFKNPLASIRAACDLLAQVEDPTERKRFAEIVAREVARMERMLSDVHEISRLEAGHGGGRERLALGTLVRGLVEAHQLRESSPLRVREIDEPLPVRAAPDRLARALQNLVDNAASLSPPGTPVEIELSRRGDEACVAVLDRGPGVPEAHRERIFARFFSDRRDDGVRGGSHVGLGLAIARAVVEAEGGRIVVRDRDSGGARFEVRLPLDPAEIAGGGPTPGARRGA